MKKLILVLLSISFSYNIAMSQEERKELRKRSPNRIILQVGGGVFSNYTYDWDPTQETFMDNPEFRMSNVTYSGMLGYRSGFNADKYKFSSTGRDKNWGNVFGVFYQTGTLDGVGLSDLGKDDMKIFITSLDQKVKFTEVQVGVVWREFLRFSGGKGTVKALENVTDILQTENVDYHLFTTGLSLRFGRLSPTFNWTLISADNFETTMSRFEIEVLINMYFWKKILHKDKHLIAR